MAHCNGTTGGTVEISERQQKIQELAKAASKLREEAARLQTNLDKMHLVQVKLYQKDLELLEYLEAGHKLKDAHLSLDNLIASIQKGKTHDRIEAHKLQ